MCYLLVVKILAIERHCCSASEICLPVAADCRYALFNKAGFKGHIATRRGKMGGCSSVCFEVEPKINMGLHILKIIADEPKCMSVLES